VREVGASVIEVEVKAKPENEIVDGVNPKLKDKAVNANASMKHRVAGRRDVSNHPKAIDELSEDPIVIIAGQCPDLHRDMNVGGQAIIKDTITEETGMLNLQESLIGMNIIPAVDIEDMIAGRVMLFLLVLIIMADLFSGFLKDIAISLGIVIMMIIISGMVISIKSSSEDFFIQSTLLLL